MELYRYYVKIAHKLGWFFVITNFLTIRDQLNVIKLLSEKFNVYYLYEAWIKHTGLISYSGIVVMHNDFMMGRGRNYQNVLRKIFGAL